MSATPHTLCFEIGGLPVAVEGEDSLSLLGQYAPFVPFRVAMPCNGGHLRWVLDADVVAPPTEPVYSMSVGMGSCRVYTAGERVWCELCPEEQSLDSCRSAWVEYDCRSGVVRLSAMPLHRLHFALWLAYNMQASSQMRFGLHAAAVACSGGAVLFLGESGTGKSTHARLWCQIFPDCWLLNDDSPVVAFRDGAVWAYGSPWSGKTPCYRTECVPLRGLVRLRQASENRVRRLGTVESLKALIPSFPPMLTCVEPFRDRMFRMLEALLAKPAAGVYAMDCLPNTAAARCCRSALE